MPGGMLILLCCGGVGKEEIGAQYWNFTVNELGQKDIAAQVDHIHAVKCDELPQSLRGYEKASHTARRHFVRCGSMPEYIRICYEKGVAEVRTSPRYTGLKMGSLFGTMILTSKRLSMYGGCTSRGVGCVRQAAAGVWLYL